MSTNNATATAKSTAPTPEGPSTQSLCAYLSNMSAGYGHLAHGPRVTDRGELIIETVRTANDAVAWIRARAGEWGTGKVQTDQLEALTERVKSVDPEGAEAFTAAAKGKSSKDAETNISYWIGEDPKAPHLRCPELLGLQGKERDAKFKELIILAGRERAAARKQLAAW